MTQGTQPGQLEVSQWKLRVLASAIKKVQVFKTQQEANRNVADILARAYEMQLENQEQRLREAQ